VVIDATNEIPINQTIVNMVRKNKQVANFFLQASMYNRFADWKYFSSGSSQTPNSN
jgi:hypothetical protein